MGSVNEMLWMSYLHGRLSTGSEFYDTAENVNEAIWTGFKTIVTDRLMLPMLSNYILFTVNYRKYSPIV